MFVTKALTQIKVNLVFVQHAKLVNINIVLDQVRVIFAESKNHIAGQPGCHGVQLLESEGHFFTFSHWESEADLNAYRESALFGEVWPKTKALFYDKPQAWTCHKTDSSEA